MSEPRRYEPNFLLELFRYPLDPGYADAAAARRERGPRPVWARRTAFTVRMAALVAIGFLLAVAWRQVIAATPERTSAHDGLVAEVKNAQTRTDDLQARAEDLRRQVAAQRQAALGPDSDALRQIRQREAATGLGPVTGPGAVVTLSDAKAPIDPTTGKATTAEANRVLDLDLQAAVNGLWAAGAEAVSINGQRITATSTIRTAGSAVLVDFRPVTSPYEISAIGPRNLRSSFEHGAVAAELRRLAERYGLGLALRDADQISLPAATGPSLRYAQPTPTGGR